MFLPQSTPCACFPSSSPASYPDDCPPPSLNFYQFQHTVGQPDPIDFGEPFFASVPSTSTNQVSHPTPLCFGPNTQHMYNMDDYDHDMKAQEALARDFQPVLEGPLVGEKKSSQAITEEYAKADAVYVAKTIHLPAIYSHYRQIAGDGSCGWRAVAFTYFETLIRVGSRDRLAQEIARVSSFNNFLMRVGGYQEMTFIDMVEETIGLLKSISDLLDTPAAAELELLQRFNESSISNYIIYHFRYLAASQLKGNPLEYQDFIPDMTIEDYCKTVLEPVHEEIDNIGMKLLIDILLKPIGISVVIAHLDRSTGSEVNHHRFPANDALGLREPMIYLLFRPTHYDILYKDFAPHPQQIPMTQPSIQVNRALFTAPRHIQGTTSTMNDFSNIDISSLIDIPGFAPPPTRTYSLPFHVQLDQTYTSPSISSSVPLMSPEGIVPSNPSSKSSLAHACVHHAASSKLVSTSPISPESDFPPINTSSSLAPGERVTSLNSQPSLASSFRPSKYEWEAAADWQEMPIPPFTTSLFKNSHYNTAHYNNPNFQPEEYVHRTTSQ